MVSGNNNVRLAHWLKGFSQWDGWLVALGGAAVLLGWILEKEVLKRVLPGLVAMNPVTALGFIVAGASLVCFWRMDERLSPWGRLLAGILVVIGVLKLASYLFGFSIPFDQILFRKPLQGGGVEIPSQIAPNTAINFLLSGIILWLLHSPSRRFSHWAQNLSFAMAFISLVSVVGYIYRASFLYSIGSFPMALPTATLFYLLAHGLLLAQGDHGAVALFTSRTPGGAITRRLLPVALAVPVILGALGIAGVKNGLYPAEFGITLVVVGSSAIFTALIWLNAVLLNRADARQKEAERKLQEAHDELEARVTLRTAMLDEANQALQARITELKRAEGQIREQAELLNKAQDAILVVDISGDVVFWSKGAERLYGWTAEEALGKQADRLLLKETFPFIPSSHQVIQMGHWTGEVQQVTKAGKEVVVESRWTLVLDEAGSPKSFLIINTNITEKKSYETQLLRSQRMDSIGALAGGIAHDLNNALAPILMGVDLLKGKRTEEDREQYLNLIQTSARRGAAMVKQILSFARGSRSFGPVQLRHLVNEMAGMVRDTFPKSISIRTNLGNPLWHVEGDATELHQVLLNLCVNARDAMSTGGHLNISAANVSLDENAISSQADALPGSYLALTVQDTGTGIPPELLPRIFEPFFTTKAADKGTGLGLSTVAHIVKQHGGFVEIKSEVGVGTEFKVYLPALDAGDVGETKPKTKDLPIGQGQLILIMDDEAVVLELARTTLENYGYRVVTASNGLQGINRFETHGNEIKLVLTDNDMPVMDGINALQSIQQLRREIPIVMASGTKRDEERLKSIDVTKLINLGKPYTTEELLNAVSEALRTSSAASN